MVQNGSEENFYRRWYWDLEVKKWRLATLSPKVVLVFVVVIVGWGCEPLNRKFGPGPKEASLVLKFV